MRDKLDVLIKMLETETEVSMPVEEPMENIIFNAKLFNTPEKVAMLKETIENFFCNHPTKDKNKINIRSKNQFFCLYAALWSRPNVLANTRITDFVKQKEEAAKLPLSLCFAITSCRTGRPEHRRSYPG